MLKPKIVAERIARARAACGHKTPYKLGRGGFFRWTFGSPSDCSGWISWLLMLRREPKPSRPYWLETTAIYKDATGKQETFVKLAEPEPGCLAVYPDAWFAKLHRIGQGHIGLITRAEPWSYVPYALQGIDCSKGSWKEFGDAIQEHPLFVFERNPKTIFVALKQDLA